MTEYMKKSDYDKYLALMDEFERCLVSCAQEISMISHDRKMIGDFTGEIDIYDEDRYLVQFETWACGESDTDSVYVPQKYIYNMAYREYYNNCLLQEKKDKELARLESEAAKEARTYRIRLDDRAEYERLKFIYGDE